MAWKVLEGVLDERLKKAELHDALHGFRQKRGCGTGIMDAKLVQQLTFVEQCPLCGLFLDLRKTYDAIDRGRCLRILEDFGAGPKAQRPIKPFWDKGVLVCKAAGCFELFFKAGRGITQGGPVSPTIYNLMVDAVIRE